MTRRDDSKAETRVLILQAAQSLFWEKGPEKCTIRGIAIEAGVSPATIIVHFKNKTALLEAVLSEDIGRVLANAMNTLPEGKGLSEILVHIASTMLVFYDNNRELYRILIRDTFFESSYESPSISRLDEEYFPFLVSLINQEKEAGRVRNNVDSLLAAHSFFYLYIGSLREFLRNPELSVSKAIETMTEMLNLYLNGILVQGVNP